MCVAVYLPAQHQHHSDSDACVACTWKFTRVYKYTLTSFLSYGCFITTETMFWEPDCTNFWTGRTYLHLYRCCISTSVFSVSKSLVFENAQLWHFYTCLTHYRYLPTGTCTTACVWSAWRWASIWCLHGLSWKRGQNQPQWKQGGFPHPHPLRSQITKWKYFPFLAGTELESVFSSGNKKKMAAVEKTELAENEFALSCPAASCCCALMKNKTLLRLIRFSKQLQQ